MGWLRRLFGSKTREDAGGVGAWSTDEEYRTADPREVVESDGVAVGAPGGAPQEDTTPDERRETQR